MNKFIAGVMGFLMMGMIVVEADAASRVSSSSRSSFSSSRSYSAPSRSYSAPKAVAAPKAASSYNGNSFFSSKPTAPKASAPTLNLDKAPSVQSKPTLKSLGFTKPAPVQTVRQPSVNVSPKPYVKSPTATTSGGWFGQKKVMSTPTKTVVTRKVSSPVAYKNTYRPRNVTVIQRNYYGNSYGGYNGYNRGYGSGYYGPQYGNSDMGASMLGGALGAFGGVMIYDAFTGNSAEKALQAQVNQLSASQQAMNNNLLLMNQSNNTTSTTPVVQKPQCFLPPDAPLMMDPKFYCGGN